MTRQATNPFGKILVQRGVLSVEALEQAVRLKERHGGSLAVNLVITGALDDQSLVGFYRERYDIDSVTEDQLARIDRAMFTLIPVEIIYDAGIMPLWLEGDEDNPRLAVGLIDPSEPEVLEEAAFFAAMELAPKLLTIGQMARHYQRLTGKRWKVDWQTVLARRRIHQARLQAESSADALDELFDAPDEREEHLRDLIEQTQKLDVSLDHLFLEGEVNDDDFVIQFVSIDGERVHEEEVVELTRVKKAFSATLVGTEVQEDERPRIAKKRKGENKHFLDPAVEGIAAVNAPSRPAPRPSPMLPSIIIDTTLLSDEEAEARLDQLVNAPHELEEAVGPDELFEDPVPTPQPLEPLPTLASPRSLDVDDDEKLYSLEVTPIEEDPSLANPSTSMAAPVAPTPEPVAFEPDLLAAEPGLAAAEAPESIPSPSAPAPQDFALDAQASGSLDRPEDGSISTDLGWFDDEMEEKLGAISRSNPSNDKGEAASLAAGTLPGESLSTIVESAAPSLGQEIPEEVSPATEAPQVEAPPAPAVAERHAETLLLSAVTALAEQPVEASPPAPVETSAAPAPAPTESPDEADSGLLEGFTFMLGEDERELEGASPQLLAALETLEVAEERDQVGVAAVSFLRQRYKRVALLSIRGNAVSPWIKWINGDAPLIPSTPELISLGSILCLDRAVTEDACFLGPVVSSEAVKEAGEGVQAVRAVLEGELPLSAVVCPISIKGRQIALLYCDEGARDAVTIDRQSMAVLKNALEEALLRVILLRKRRRL